MSVVAFLAQADPATDGSAVEAAAESAAHWVLDLVFVAAVVVGAWLATRVGRVVATIAVDKLARRARAGKSSRWRVRLPRLQPETDEIAELRRQHRVDATAKMVSRVASVLVWFLGLILVLHHFDVDVMLVVSGAGFLGLALAVGGQHSVHDYITGLHVLLEDRFWVGDEIEVVTLTGERVRGVVANVGVFATRIESDGSTWHIANRALNELCNLSQRGVPARIEVGAGVREGVAGDAIAAAARDAFDEITKGHVIVDEVKPVSHDEPDRGPRYEVALRTHRGLSGHERDRLTEGTQRRIDSREGEAS